MSHTLDFTHLEGETDDSADFGIAVNELEDTSISISPPSIPPPPKVSRNKRHSGTNSSPTGSSDAAVLPSTSQSHTNQADVSKGPSEGFEDSFINGPSVSDNDSQTTSSDQVNGGVDNQSEKTGESDGVSSSPSTFKIHYDSSKGNVTVFEGQVTTRPDGSQHINTQDIHDQWLEHDQPLRHKKIRLIKIFSIIACIFFFPSGIPAVYYAFRIDKEFEEGIMRGNIDRAQKFAKRSQHLIVLSFVLAAMIAVLTIALIERPYYESADYHKGTVVG